MTATTAPHDFGEIASLQEVFNEAKKSRKGRPPQYVMLVEDDPLIRSSAAHHHKDCV